MNNYLIMSSIFYLYTLQPCGLVNLSVKKDVNKVVDSIDIEDITEKAAFCRCWRSKNVSSYIFYKNFYLLSFCI